LLRKSMQLKIEAQNLPGDSAPQRARRTRYRQDRRMIALPVVRLRMLALLAAILWLATGCSWILDDKGLIQDRRNEYREARTSRIPDVPADLDSSRIHDAMVVPEVPGMAKYRKQDDFELPRPATLFAREEDRGVRILEAKEEETHAYQSQIKVRASTKGGGESHLVSGTVFGRRPRFVRIEDVILNNLDLLLPGARVLSAGFFRVTRNAIVERDGETANDLLEMIEAELRDRQFAPVVRLEVSPDLSPALREHLVRELEFSGPEDIFESRDMLGVRDLMQLVGLDRPDLKDPPHVPVDHPRLARAASIFDELDTHGPILLKHPYQSFDTSVIRLLREAVLDPYVLAIKTTLYRTSEESEIVPLLIEAVKHGKQVAVAVELQARFDEAANIRWANRLEEAGIHVSYGVVGYKTHTKAMLILRRKPQGGLRRYVHIGTGNYNSTTARLYSDLGLLTSDKVIGADTTEIFNLMTSGSLSGRRYTELLVSPLTMKPRLLRLIEREIEHHRDRGDGLIQLKTNALEDADIVRALYEATRAGVQVDLIVRDSCRLRPGIPGLSESARVVSIVGRFLEHARLYYFRNGGSEEYYIGSADLMSRNLERRVEALVPIKTPPLMEELREFLDLQLEDRYGAWLLDADGSYQRSASTAGEDAAQMVMLEQSRRDGEKSSRPGQS